MFVITCLGIGLMGASCFFSLEIKQGREPITWLVEVLARIFSGVYYPLSILPLGIRRISSCIPHTYALRGIRRVMMSGHGLGDAGTRQAFLMLLVFCLASLLLGMHMLNRALVRAEQTNGVGMVV